MDERLDNIENLSYDDLFDLVDDIDFEEEKQEINDIEGKEKEACSNCGKFDTIVEDFAQGVMVCNDCGQVSQFVMDQTLESRNYGEDGGSNTNSRCSTAINVFTPQSSLSTTIACHPKSKIKMLHTWVAMPYEERSLYGVIKEIQFRCQKACIPKCIEDDAKIMYKKISECRHPTGKNKGKKIIIRGANRRALIAACVFFACKKNKQTRSPKEIAILFELKYKEITKGFKTFEKLMKLRKMSLSFDSSLPEDFVPRYCRELQIKKEYVDQAVKITKNIRRLNVASIHTPLSIATGAILLMIDMNHLKITKKEIAQKFEVSEVTLSKTYKRIEKFKHIVVSDTETERIIKESETRRKTMELPDSLKKRFARVTMESKLCSMIDDDVKNYVDKRNIKFDFTKTTPNLSI